MTEPGMDAPTLVQRTGGIYAKVNELMRQLTHVSKDHKVEAGGSYKYRSYTDLFDAARPIMIELGIVPETHFQASREENGADGLGTFVDGKQRTNTYAAGIFTVFLIDVADGSRVMYQAPTISTDTSDKAAGKALSYAIKNALFAGLMIPVEEAKDHDATRPEPGSRTPRTPKAKATELKTQPDTTGWLSALAGAESVEELNAVAREAKKKTPEEDHPRLGAAYKSALKALTEKAG